MFGCNVGQCYDTRWANTAGQTAAVPMLQGRSLGLERLGLETVLKVERLGLESLEKSIENAAVHYDTGRRN